MSWERARSRLSRAGCSSSTSIPRSFEGRARVAPELNDEVWSKMIEGERQQDPERGGVAVLIEIDSVSGAGADGFFQQART